MIAASEGAFGRTEARLFDVVYKVEGSAYSFAPRVHTYDQRRLTDEKPEIRGNAQALLAWLAMVERARARRHAAPGEALIAAQAVEDCLPATLRAALPGLLSTLGR